MGRGTLADTEETRQAVLRAGLTLFSQYGYATTRLEDVAQAAGVTRGAIYWHFASKAAHSAALVDDASARLEQVIAAARSSGGSIVIVTRRVMVRMLAYLEAG